MIQRIAGPEATHPVANTPCYWVAAYNYIRFKYQRQDAIYLNVTDIDGFARFNLSDLQIAPGIDIEVGDTLYISGQNYNSACKVTAAQPITIGGNPSVGYVTNLPFNGSYSGYINNLSRYPKWKLEVIVSIYDTNNNLQDIATAYYRALPNGNVWVDIQEYIKSYLANNFVYSTANNATDNGGSVKFTQRYRVVLDDENATNFAEEETYYAANAAMQAGQPLAPNMANYLMQELGGTGMFLSAFKEPTYWKGYPFSLSFLYAEDGSGYSAVKRWYDINKTQISSTNNGTLSAYPGNNCMLNVEYGVESSLPYEYISMEIRGGTFPYPAIGEEKVMRVKTPCATANEVMLVWRNQLGGWDYYLFEARHTQNLTVENGQVFEAWIEDLSSSQNNTKLLSKKATESITLAAAGIDKNDAEGIKSLLKSVAVYILQTEAPYAAQRVFIEPGSWVIHNTKAKRTDIEFTITKPTEQLQHE